MADEDQENNTAQEVEGVTEPISGPPPEKLSPGEKMMEALRADGRFSDEELSKIRNLFREKLIESGQFNEQEVRAMFNEGTFDPKVIQNHGEMIIEKLVPTATVEDAGNTDSGADDNPRATTEPIVAKSFLDMFKAGWEQSVLGLAYDDDGVMDYVMPEEAGIMDQLVAAAGTMSGDMLTFLAGGTVGALGGAALGTMVFPGIGTIGSAAGGFMTGGFALVEGTKASLIEAYRLRQAEKASDYYMQGTYWAAMIAGEMKGATMGAGGSRVGNIVTKSALPAAAPAMKGLAGREAGKLYKVSEALAKKYAKGSPLAGEAIRHTAIISSEMATIEALSAAIDRRVPSWESFLVGALTIAPFRGYKIVRENMANRWVKTGDTPEQQARKAHTDPNVMADVTKGEVKNHVRIIEEPSPEVPILRAERAIEADMAPIAKGVKGERRGVRLPKQLENLIEEAAKKHGVDPKRLAQFMHAYRTVELAANGKKTTLDPRLANAYVSEMADSFLPVIKEMMSSKSARDKAGVTAKQAKQMFNDVYAKTLVNKVNDTFGKPVRPPRENWRQTFENIYTAVFDENFPVKMKIGERTYNYSMLNSNAIAEAFIRNGVRDFKTGKIIGESYYDILKPIQKDGTYIDFRSYVTAARQRELIQKGEPYLKEVRGPDNELIRTMTAKEWIEVADVLDIKYKKHAMKLQKFKDQVLDYFQQSGMRSKKAMELIKNASDDHVPLHKFFEETPTGRKGGGDPIKFRRGMEVGQFTDPLAAIEQNTMMMIRLAEHNRLLRSAVKEAPDGTFVKIPARMRPVTIRSTEKGVMELLAKYGVDAADAEETAQVFRPVSQRVYPDMIEVYVNGKPQLYKTDPALANVLNNVRTVPEFNLAMKLLQAPAIARRAGVVLSPSFMIANAIRDTLIAAIQSKHGFKPVKGTVRGLERILSKDEFYKEYVSSGGLASDIRALDYTSKFAKGLTDAEMMNIREKTVNTVLTAADYANLTGTLLENAPRVEEYALARQKGLSVEEAARAAQEVTVNFGRKGGSRTIQVLARLTPFMNVGIQSLDRLARNFKDNPAAANAWAISTITLPSMWLWYMNKDDPRMRQIPPHHRDLNWIIPTDKWVDATAEEYNNYSDEQRREPTPGVLKDANGYMRRTLEDGTMQVNVGAVFRIPKPFEYGVAYGSSVERVLDRVYTSMYNRDPELFDASDVGKQIWSSLPSPIPAAFEPFVEVAMNKSIFTGRPITPFPLEQYNSDIQYTEYTTKTGRVIGKIIEQIPFVSKNNRFAAPAVVDHFVQSWSGTLGRESFKALDKPVGAAGSMGFKVLTELGVPMEEMGFYPNHVEAPETKFWEQPIIRQFNVRYPTMRAESITKFYDASSEMYRDMASDDKEISNFQKKFMLNEAELAMRRKELNLESMKYSPEIIEFRSSISSQIVAINETKARTDLTPGEKRRMIDSYLYLAINEAEEGLKMLKEFEQEKKERGLE